MSLEHNYKKIGIRIVQRRKELSLSQKQLAKKINISNNHLSNIEHGKALPSFTTFLDICSVLKVNPDYIIHGIIYSELSEELTEKIKKCQDEDKIKISKIIDIFLE